LKATLGAKNGVKAAKYEFKLTKLTSTSGTYSSLMIAKCKSFGMRPVCDHPAYCRNDKQSLYLGQSSHISYPGHRNHGGFGPTGFDKVRDNWKGLCVYTKAANGIYALCNVPINSISWKSPKQYNPGFMCGRTSTQAALQTDCMSFRLSN
jgi:hypothetical protein